jgi:hypothetical protein
VGYYIDSLQFDGYRRGVLLDAKHLEDEGRFAKAYENMNKGKFGDIEYLCDKAGSLLEQAKRQVAAAKPSGTPIEWHVSGQNAARAIRRLFKAYNIKITVKYVPFKG